MGGSLSVLVSIDRNGNVTGVNGFRGPGNICSSTTRPSVSRIRDAAANAARTVRFEPARAGSIPVESTGWLLLEVGTPKVESGGTTGTTYVGPVTSGDGQRYTVIAPSTATSTFENIAPPPPPPPPGVGTGNDSVAGRRNLSGGVLNGKALSLPRPTYPPAARAVKASGAVVVQVLIDEDGSLFTATAVSGHPLLRAASTLSACEARFSPTLLEGKPVKVSGVITYNYVAP